MFKIAMKLKKLTEHTIRLTHLDNKKDTKVDETEIISNNIIINETEIDDAQIKSLINSSLVTNDFDLDLSIDLDSSSK